MLYEVIIKQIEQYHIPEIEADSEKEARELAYDLLAKDSDNYHDDSDVGMEIFEIQDGG